MSNVNAGFAIHEKRQLKALATSDAHSWTSWFGQVRHTQELPHTDESLEARVSQFIDDVVPLMDTKEKQDFINALHWQLDTVENIEANTPGFAVAELEKPEAFKTRLTHLIAVEYPTADDKLSRFFRDIRTSQQLSYDHPLKLYETKIIFNSADDDHSNAAKMITSLLTQLLGDDFEQRLGSDTLTVEREGEKIARVVFHVDKLCEFIKKAPLKSLDHAKVQASDFHRGEIEALCGAYEEMSRVAQMSDEERLRDMGKKDLLGFGLLSMLSLALTPEGEEQDPNAVRIAAQHHPLRPLVDALGLKSVEELPDHLPGIVKREEGKLTYDSTKLEALLHDTLEERKNARERQRELEEARRQGHRVEQKPNLTLEEAQAIKRVVQKRGGSRGIPLLALEKALGVSPQTDAWWQQKLSGVGRIDFSMADVGVKALDAHIATLSKETTTALPSYEEFLSVQRAPADTGAVPGEKGKPFIVATLERLLGKNWADKLKGMYSTSSVNMPNGDEVILVDTGALQDRLRSENRQQAQAGKKSSHR